MEQNRCIAKTKNGDKCTRTAKSNNMCTQHFKVFEKNNKPLKKTITITFGDVAENHARMQKIGNIADRGFSIDELKKVKKYFESRGCNTELVNLKRKLLKKNPEYRDSDGVVDARILIVRDALSPLLSDIDKTTEDFMNEQEQLTWDTKAFMKGKVVNKHARYNLCYSDKDQKADYGNGKGTIVSFDKVPILQYLRNTLPKIMGKCAENLNAEGNLYYDVSKCGIGFHGDGERRKVIALRLGETMPLHYQWFQNSKPVGKRIKLKINDGDLYIMSEKAVGFDWLKKKKLTLRHAAGCKKFLTIK